MNHFDLRSAIAGIMLFISSMLSAQTITGVCNDGGTPNDPSDDRLEFTIDGNLNGCGIGFGTVYLSIRQTGGTFQEIRRADNDAGVNLGAGVDRSEFPLTFYIPGSNLGQGDLDELRITNFNTNCFYTVTDPGTCFVVPPCDVSLRTVNVSQCNTTTNEYEVQTIVDYVSPPSGENITIFLSTGESITIVPDTDGGISGADLVTFSGLTSDGQPVTITGGFTGASGCILTPETYTAPAQCFFPLCTGAADAIGGFAFQDLSDDGNFQIEEARAEGITVRIFDATGTEVCMTTTNAAGEYLCTGLDPAQTYRVEFSTTGTDFNPSTSQSPNTTDVQFVTPGTCNANFGTFLGTYVSCPADELDLIVPCYVNGTTANNEPTLIALPYNSVPGTPKTVLATDNQTGTLWGAGYEPRSSTIYVSAVYRRHAALGPGGPGAIYPINIADLNNPIVGAPIIVANAGTDVHSGLPAGGANNDPSHDPASFDAVGKVGIGDMEVDATGTTIYATNLNTRSVVEIDIATGAEINSYPIPSGTCSGPVGQTDNDIRPWALKISGGDIYVGVVCSGETNGTQPTGFVYRLSGVRGSLTYSLFQEIDLSYDRPQAWDRDCYDNSPGNYKAWISSFPAPTCVNPFGSGEDYVSYEQPIISDIEFDVDGSMIIGILDRFGLQSGFLNYGTDVTSTQQYVGISSGDIRRYCNFGGQLVQEGTAGCETPNGIEFYFGDTYTRTGFSGHQETVQGGLALLPGTNEVAAAAYDPIDEGPFNSAGIRWLSNETGDVNRATLIFDNSGSDPGTFAKAAGLGDLELTCQGPSQQIGNYVWIDANGDGVQGPDETPLAGVPVSLYDANGQFLMSTVTDVNGEYYFDVEAETAYSLVFGFDGTTNTRVFDPATMELTVNGETYSLTTANTGEGTNPDQNDSDATLQATNNAFTSGLPVITFPGGSLGENDHTLDVGFRPPVVLEHEKMAPVISQTGPRTYNVAYTITVTNSGGQASVYDLTDVPAFDDDIEILAVAYASNAPGNPGGTLAVPAAGGSLSLATNQAISGAGTAPTVHTYTVSFTVEINLDGGSGDDLYAACGAAAGAGGGFIAGEGLYNESFLDAGSTGVVDQRDTACADLPYVTHVKSGPVITGQPDGSYDAVYTVTVVNEGGADGTYDLGDTPQFDDDVTINSLAVSTDAPGNVLALANMTATSGTEIQLAANQSIAPAPAPGSTQTYTLTFNVTLDLSDDSTDGGDNLYNVCGTANGNTNPAPGEGLFNRSELDLNGDGTAEETEEVCGDLPFVTHTKVVGSVTQLADGSYDLVYLVTVTNEGGVAGSYSLTDTPGFDDDIVINSATAAVTSSGTNTPATPTLTATNNATSTLATNQAIDAGANHVYTLTFNIDLDLTAGSGGDDSYTACAGGDPTATPGPGQGLYNASSLETTGDTTPEEMDFACADITALSHEKTITNVGPLQADGSRDITYEIVVTNEGDAADYNLTDTPGFDDDITINSLTVTTDAPGNTDAAVNTTASSGTAFTLATDQAIAAGTDHTYTLVFNVTLDLADGGADGGDDTYTACGAANGAGDPSAGEGLFNQSALDTNDDGMADQLDDACGDLPAITHDKQGPTVSTIQPDGSYDVVYTIVVTNIGGAFGTYELYDTPGFEDDITINGTPSFTATTDGANAPSGGTLSTTSGTRNALELEQGIAPGETHTFTLTYNVTLDLNGGPDGGDDSYTACGTANGDLDPEPGEGLYNMSELNLGGDPDPEEVDEVCGDLPAVTHTKVVGNVTQLPDGSYDVVYLVTVANEGGVAGSYSLTDTPGFDDDIVINSATAAVNSNGTNTPATPTLTATNNAASTLATNQAIDAGANHVYTLTFNIDLNLTAGSGGDDSYTACAGGDPTATPGPGQGLYNASSLETTGDTTPDEMDFACADITALSHEKTITNVGPLQADGSRDITYEIVVTNEGDAANYNLTDTPGFDDDITINALTVTTDAPGNTDAAANTTATSGSAFTLATDQAIAAGTDHTYTLVFNVTLDLNDGGADGGDDTYTACGAANGAAAPLAGEGLFNQSALDTNDDGMADQLDDACGDLPVITHDKMGPAISTVQTDGSYDVVYTIVVTNIGGAFGTYELYDTPDFENDITINGTPTYTATTDGANAPSGGTLSSTSGTRNALELEQGIDAGETHTFTLTFNVTLDLDGGADSGDDFYTPCGSENNIDEPEPGEGLYNRSELELGGGPAPEEIDEVCGDLPFVTHQKTLSGVSLQPDGSYNAVYEITVTNEGGATGTYTLEDTPGFDDDFVINTASVTTATTGTNTPPVVTIPTTNNTTTALATDQAVEPFEVQTYTLTFNVTLDLSDGTVGDDAYVACGTANPGGDPVAGEGLFNASALETTGDTTPEQTDFACGDVSAISHTKTFVSRGPQQNDGSYDVTYEIVVTNDGGTDADYNLTDTPDFDDDMVINSLTVTTDAPGNTLAAANTTASSGTEFTLAEDQTITNGTPHTYTLVFNVTLMLRDAPGVTGDSLYVACGTATGDPANPSPGEALYNQSSLDVNDDGVADQTAEACGELPAITHNKTVSSVSIQQPDGSYNVTYVITVTNDGGAFGTYDLGDTPNFDDDIVINGTPTYTATTDGANAPSGGTLSGTNGVRNDLELEQGIDPGEMHTFTLTYNVTLDLDPASTDGGDNVYVACGEGTGDDTDPSPGEGLYNGSDLNTGGDPTPEEVDEACVDLPFITHTKVVTGSPVLQANGSYNVTYTITVTNEGGAPGDYNLSDTPGFDDDITINSATVTPATDGANMPAAATVSTTNNTPTVLVSDQAIDAGETQTYVLLFNVELDLTASSGGDNSYTACGTANGMTDPEPGEGLYNQSSLDINDDQLPDETDEACADLVAISVTKEDAVVSVQQPDGSYNISYEITVENTGGGEGTYSLFDTPQFDDDVTINGGGFSVNGGGVTAFAAPANGQQETIVSGATLAAMSTITYTVTFNVTLDLTDAAGVTGDNNYLLCGTADPTGAPSPGEGLYNEAAIDVTGDGVPDQSDEACGELPAIEMSKIVAAMVFDLGGGNFQVTYQITVDNSGGADGMYALTDTPLFDDDVEITAVNLTAGPAGSGFTDLGATPLGTDIDLTPDGPLALAAGATDIFTLQYTISVDLDDGMAVGDDVFTPCGTGTTPNDPSRREGLLNAASLDTNGDGMPEQQDDACAEVPVITQEKMFSSVSAQLADGSYDVVYTIVVSNDGNADGAYDLFDTPGFDDDVEINSLTVTTDATGNTLAAGNTTATSGSTLTLANDQAITANAQQTYTLSFNVTLDLETTVPLVGDNTYVPCGGGAAGAMAVAGQGLYNASSLDTNNDSMPESESNDCGDLPAINLTKAGPVFTPGAQANGVYTATYTITVENAGGSVGQYDLSDVPGFDDDIVITGLAVTTDAPGNTLAATNTTATSGTEILLADDQDISGGATHTYTLAFMVDLDLTNANPDGGDNEYTPCGDDPLMLGPVAGEGMFNAAFLDTNNDGEDDKDTEVCDDLPVVDVALTKVVVPASLGANFLADEDEVIEFEITVVNQGTVPVTMVDVYDAIPCGFSFFMTAAETTPLAANAAWSYDVTDESATATIAGPIQAGASETISIFLRTRGGAEFDPVVCPSDIRLTNLSEIAEIDIPDGMGGMTTVQEDEDSEFDEGDDAEDGGGMVNDVTDNVVDGDGSGVQGDNDPNTDDDDSDPANVESVDVALRKTIDTIASPPPYVPGESVRFRIEIFNQGTQDITSVDVVDVFPSGIEFDAVSSSADWSYDGGTRTASRTLDLSGTPLTPGDDTEIFIFGVLQVPTDAAPEEQYTNVAEISGITAIVMGVPTMLTQDADSPLDNDVTNNSGGMVNTDDDDEINGGGPGRGEDQDNADPAFVNVALLSLGSTVWIDENNNGVQDDGEEAVPGVQIQLIDAAGNPIDIGPDGVLNSADDNQGLPYVTDAEGNYYFSNLTPGDYSLSIPATMFAPGQPLEDFPVSSNTTSGTFAGELDPDTDLDNDDHGLQMMAGGVVVTDTITLMTNDEPLNDVETAQGGMQDDANGADASGNMTLDLGFTAPVTVGDFTFIDLNMDGIQDDGDLPLPGVTVAIIDVATGELVDTDLYGNPYQAVLMTDANGMYLFDSLPPGNYAVNFDYGTAANADLYVYTTTDAGGNDAADNDITAANPDNSQFFGSSPETGFLAANEEDLTIDAGVVCNVQVTTAPPATLCGTQDIDLTTGATVIPASLGGRWASSGDGIFFDADGDELTGIVVLGEAVLYRPGSLDRRRGEVTLTLTTNDPRGLVPLSPCTPASSSTTFTILNVDCGSFFWDGGQ